MLSLSRRIWLLMLVLALCATCVPGIAVAEETAPVESAASQDAESAAPNDGAVLTEANAALPEEPADGPAPISPAEETAPPAAPEEPEPKGRGLYFGQLHSHCDLSDGAGTVEEAFSYAAAVPGLDFLAVTDHSESLSGASEATLTQDMTAVSADWAAGKAAAAVSTSRDFVGIYGYEMSWPGDKEIGHINTFGTPGFVSWQQPAFSGFSTALQNYAAALAQVPGSVSQFNHPGPEFGDFRGFTQYSPALDNAVQLLEVGTGAEGYDYYTRALDLGWHVAPTCSGNNHNGYWGAPGTGRTVVAANTLTEEGIYEALRNHRAYATGDDDLHIWFADMGSRLNRQAVGKELTLSVSLYDPTDAIGRVEVIVNGGAVIAGEDTDANRAEFTFPVTAAYDYYYLKITQPDGDTAVTAPIWLERAGETGITTFTCDAELPTQGKPLKFSLTVRNEDVQDLLIRSLELTAEGEIFYSSAEEIFLPFAEEQTWHIPATLYCLGMTEITAILRTELAGESQEYRCTLSLGFHREDTLSAILVDGAHGNLGITELEMLKTLATKNRLELTLAEEETTAPMLSQAAVFVITAPTETFSETFVEETARFVRYGGTLLLCGQSGEADGGFAASQLNRILSAAESAVTFRPDTALDETNAGDSPDQLYLPDIRRDSPWCSRVTEDQLYRHVSGCTLAGGNWLVKGRESTASSDGTSQPVLLTWEQCAAGKIFAGGSLWILDAELREAENFWDVPYANRTVLENILDAAPPEIGYAAIGDLRQGTAGIPYTVRGYITAGTARPGNQFPNTVYIQDNTGGIAVTPFAEKGIDLGTPMEITGYLETAGQNRYLRPVSWKVLDSRHYRFEGLTGQGRELMDNSLHSGQLIQLEGFAERIQLREDGTVQQIILRQRDGHYATLLIEEEILSGTYGINDLAQRIPKGAEVRALGILHRDADGTSVLRVRNCDEVIAIDPWPYTKIRDKSNPNSGDGIGLWLALGILSGCALARNVVSWRKRYKRSPL